MFALALAAGLLPWAPSAVAAELGPAHSTGPISVVYPFENEVLPPANAAWINGSISNPEGRFRINGATVPVYRTGAFLAWLPVASGTFTFHCDLTLRDGTTQGLARTIYVTPTPAPLPSRPVTIDPESVAPHVDELLRPGDTLVVRARATPGVKMQFRVWKHGWLAMREYNPGAGLYEGTYLVQPGDEQDPAPIELRAAGASARSGGKVGFSSSQPPVATVRGTGGVNLKTGPAEGELFPVLGGVRLLTAGQWGPETKVTLSGGQSGWIETKNIDLLPGASPPRAVADTIGVKKAEDSTVVHIGISDRVPFSVEENDDLTSLTIRLHYTASHINWIVYDSADDFVDQVQFEEEAADLLAVRIRLRPGRRIWGYQAAYEAGSLRFELRHPPLIADKPLAGRVIFLDPGHMPSAPGAMGPTGTKEMDVNFLIAKEVERLLLRAGAKPIMSRATNEDEVGLPDRPKMAWEKHAEIFVSIHNENLPSDSNPFKSPHGYSIFYFHPHSFELARDLYAAYSRHVTIAGEQLRYGNLLVARATAMPSVLTESAYLTYPDQEEMLLDPKFRRKLAESIVDGLATFLARERFRQAGPPTAKRRRPS